MAIVNDQLMIRNAKHQSVKVMMAPLSHSLVILLCCLTQAAHEELSQLPQFQVSQPQSLSFASSSFPTNPFNTGAAPPVVMSSLSTPILGSSSSAVTHCQLLLCLLIIIFVLQDDIAIKLSAESGMNIEWSKK